MSTTDGNKTTGKPGQRKRKAERNRKSAQRQSPKPDQLQDTREPISATVASTDISPTAAVAPTDTAPIGAAAPTDAPPIGTATPGDAAPIGAAPSADAVAVSFRTIANAYGDYTRKSLEEAQSFVDKLTGVRSLNKAVEVQTEFAKQACETFVAESQKISELHKELAKQMFKPLGSLMARPTRTPR